jgi:hypothetical protein
LSISDGEAAEKNDILLAPTFVFVTKLPFDDIVISVVLVVVKVFHTCVLT